MWRTVITTDFKPIANDKNVGLSFKEASCGLVAGWSLPHVGSSMMYSRSWWSTNLPPYGDNDYSWRPYIQYVSMMIPMAQNILYSMFFRVVNPCCGLAAGLTRAVVASLSPDEWKKSCYGATLPGQAIQDHYLWRPYIRADDEISYGAMVAPRMKQCMGGCAAYDFEPNERLCT